MGTLAHAVAAACAVQKLQRLLVLRADRTDKPLMVHPTPYTDLPTRRHLAVDHVANPTTTRHDNASVFDSLIYGDIFSTAALRACPRGYLFRWEAAPVDFDRMVLDRLHHRLQKFRATSLFGGNGKPVAKPAVAPATAQVSASLAERAQHTVSTGEDLGVQTTRLSVEADKREAGRQLRTAADAVVSQGFVDARADADADDARAARRKKPTKLEGNYTYE